MSNFITFLQTYGEAPGTYREFRQHFDNLIAIAPNLVQVRHVAGGTSTVDFEDEWGGFAVPDVAFVIEGSAVWYTDDGGANWYAITQASSIRTGVVEMCFDTVLPTGYLWCDGSAQLIASYSDLNTYLNTHIAATSNLRRKWAFQTTWTSTSQATFTFLRPFSGLTNGDTIDLYWNDNANSRLGMTLSAVSTTSFVASGGVGDNIPNQAAPDIFGFSMATTKFFLPDMRDAVPQGVYNMGGTDVGYNDLYADTLIAMPYEGGEVSEYNYQYHHGYMQLVFIIKT